MSVSLYLPFTACPKMRLLRLLPYIAPLLLVSCLKEKRTLAEHRPQAIVKDTVLKIAPLETKLNKLSWRYRYSKRNNIDNFYDNLWKKNDLSGGFLVAKNGQIIYEDYGGYANRKTKEEINKNTPIHIASVSKVLTAAVVLKLIDRDKLTLDQKVNTILPEFPYEDITIKMLLNHRSGLPNYAYFCDDRKIWDRSMLTNQDILDLFAQHKFSLYFRPDKKFGYCNTNYAMLALIKD